VNVSGEDTTGRDASGGRGADGDEAAWRDLIARFDMPEGHLDAAPWPERESLTPASGPADQETADAQTADPGTADPIAADPTAADPTAADLTAADPGTASPGTADKLRGADRGRVIRPAAPQPNGISVPLPPADAAGAGLAGPDQASADAADIHEEEHFVPPPPPPLPHLDSVAKGAWTALFGGPAYLLAATLMGWVVPGWAALLAVIAFVGGFAMVAVRLGDRRSDDTGSDDGAVL
jgi:hypothetical protein